MNENEAQNVVDLAGARGNTKSNKPISKIKALLSFREKISKYWVILWVAAIFDLFALIPFVSVIFNLLFGLILYLYFGSKKKASGSSNLFGIVLPILLGSALDWILSFIPVNIMAALIRIALADDTAMENNSDENKEAASEEKNNSGEQEEQSEELPKAA